MTRLEIEREIRELWKRVDALRVVLGRSEVLWRVATAAELSRAGDKLRGALDEIRKR